MATDSRDIVQEFSDSKNCCEVFLPTDAKPRPEPSGIPCEMDVLAQVVESAAMVIVGRKIRLLGAGDGLMHHDIYGYSEQVQRIYGFDGLLVAEDVWGGLFVLEGHGGRRSNEAPVAYFAPDTLGWERVAPDYGTFLQATGRKTYRDLRTKLGDIVENNPNTTIITELIDWGAY